MRPANIRQDQARPILAMMLGIILFAFAIRIFRIDVVPLRGDEAFTLTAWTQPLNVVLRDVARIDPQPPLAFISMRTWVQFAGSTPLAARFFSALWSVFTVAPLYQIGRRVAGTRAGLLAAILWAVNPFQVWHAQDVRNYTLWTAWSVTGTWLLLITVTTQKVRRRTAYVLSTAIAAYTFYLEALVIMMHNVYALWCLRKDRPLTVRWILTQVALAALLAPWYLQLPRLSSGDYRGTGEQLTSTPEILLAIPGTTRTLLFGTPLPPTNYLQTLATVLALLVIAVGGYLLVTRGAHRGRFIGLYAILPLALFLVLSTIGRFYRPRYLNGVVASYAVILAGTVIWLSKASAPMLRWLARALLFALLITNAASLTRYFFDPAYKKAPDWPALTETLAQNVRPGDMIIRNAPDPSFDFYYAGPGDQLTLPDEEGLSEQAIASRLDAVFATTSRVWFIPINHPYWDPDEAVATYLATNSQLIYDTRAGNMRLQQWSSWAVRPDEIPYVLDWQIDDLVTMRGFDTIPEFDGTSLTIRPSASITLIVYWEPLKPSQRPYTTFAHLLGPTNPEGGVLWAGDDHPPQNGRVSTTSWKPGILLRDVHTFQIPADAAPGRYQITLGMYDSATGERLPVISAQSPGERDSIPVVELIVGSKAVN